MTDVVSFIRVGDEAFTHMHPDGYFARVNEICHLLRIITSLNTRGLISEEINIIFKLSK